MPAPGAIGGVSSYLQEADLTESPASPASPHPQKLVSPQLLVLSAASESELDQAAMRLRAYLERNQSVRLADIAHSLQMRAGALPYRRVVVCKDRGDALAALSEAGSKRVLSARVDTARRPVVLLLPGVGDQYVGMGHELYLHWKVFKAEVDRCAQILEPHIGIDIREVLYPAHGAWRTRGGEGKGLNLKQMLAKSAASGQDPETLMLNRTRYAQPALFTIEYATARLLQSIGIHPDAIVGHSMGEYVAACLAGVFSVEDALRLIAVRASLVDDLPQGAMLSVLMSEQEILPLLGADLSVSLLNGPNNCVVAGEPAAVDDLERRLEERDVISRRVQNGHAFHTKALDPILPAFKAQAAQVRFGLPRIPYASNVIGDWITAGLGSEAGYWAQHATRAARFNDTLGRTWDLGDPILIECGPGRTLSVLAAQHPARKVSKLGAIYTLRQSYEDEPDDDVLLRAIGKAWLSGATIDWSGIHGSAPHLSALPALLLGADEPPGGSSQDRAAEPLIEPGADRNEAGYVAPRNDLEISLTRVCERVLGLSRVGITDNFFELGGHSLAVIRLIMEMKQTTGLEIDLGEVFRTPTILDLVSNLGASARKSASLVVPLQPKGDAVPIFCICGIEIYRDFANSLGENQPVCGVYVDEERAIINEVMGGKTSGVSIDRLVEAYDAAIVRFRPQGPYRLAGLSFGGMLAVELASKIRKRGAAVEFVFLFDTLLPEGRRRRWSSWLLRQAREMAGPEGRRKLAKLYGKLRARFGGKTAAATHGNAAFYQEFAGRQRAAFFEAEKKWQVRTEIDFPVILFRASEHDMWGEDLEFAEDYGWRRHVGDRLHIVPVTGGHRSIIEPPNVADLGRRARAYLTPAA
jgi:malonyl CoA-acyl carrier protein transacylase/thioesterase domain-containing protein/acyl carrier protein